MIRIEKNNIKYVKEDLLTCKNKIKEVEDLLKKYFKYKKYDKLVAFLEIKQLLQFIINELKAIIDNYIFEHKYFMSPFDEKNFNYTTSIFFKNSDMLFLTLNTMEKDFLKNKDISILNNINEESIYLKDISNIINLCLEYTNKIYKVFEYKYKYLEELYPEKYFLLPKYLVILKYENNEFKYMGVQSDGKFGYVNNIDLKYLLKILDKESKEILIKKLVKNHPDLLF